MTVFSRLRPILLVLFIGLSVAGCPGGDSQEGEGEPEGVGEGTGEGAAEGVGEGIGEGLGEGLGEGVGEGAGEGEGEPMQPPNLIVIMADDLGYADLSITGALDFSTPNIDGIAHDGVWFTNAYACAALCSPSRAGIESGRFPATFGYQVNPNLSSLIPEDYGIPVEIETIGQTLQRSGVYTGFIGKWHLGHSDKHHPNNNGYDEFYGFLDGPVRVGYFLPDPTVTPLRLGEMLLRNYQVTHTTEYLTDALNREAMEFVERNQDRPFFLFLSHAAPHIPLEAPQALVSQFDHIPDFDRRVYAAMITSLDDSVGRLLGLLRDLDLDDNTVVIFTNDNGGAGAYSSNAPFSGKKGSLNEGGLRVPFFMRYPGVIPAGITYSNPIFLGDIFGTAAGLAGATPPPIDGVNLIPHVTGENLNPPHDALFWAMVNDAVTRQGVWRLSYNPNSGPGKLFNVDLDPGQTTDRSANFPLIREALLDDLVEWASELPPPLFFNFIKSSADSEWY